MSYILEALKKSQREREVGRAPTLETPNFPLEEKGTRPNLWVLPALILAALAVVIALYSALHDSSPPVTPVTRTTPHPAAREAWDQDPETLREEEPATRPAPRQASPQQQVPDTPSLRWQTTTPPVPVPVEPETAASPAVTEAPVPPPAPPDQVPESPVAVEKPPVVPAPEPGSEIPSDLIADIEAFKREVVAGQTGVTDIARVEEKTDPRNLRLPPAVRSRLPGFVMSAHIYDSEPSRRFVLINGLKVREGEMSFERIGVERILSDGAVLSFDGHRFFQRR